jgi:hypothetical protein
VRDPPMIAVAYPFGGGLYANGAIDQRPSAILPTSNPPFYRTSLCNAPHTTC